MRLSKACVAAGVPLEPPGGTPAGLREWTGSLGNAATLLSPPLLLCHAKCHGLVGHCVRGIPLHFRRGARKRLSPPRPLLDSPCRHPRMLSCTRGGASHAGNEPCHGMARPHVIRLVQNLRAPLGWGMPGGGDGVAGAMGRRRRWHSGALAGHTAIASRGGGGCKDNDDDDGVGLLTLSRPSLGVKLLRRREQRPLRVATLCSGIEAPIQALEQLCIPFRHVAACEKDPVVRRVLAHNFAPEVLHEDLAALQPGELPPHDLLFVGFPCQPWSSDGVGKGFLDLRGALIIPLVQLISETMPPVAVLENVKGLATARHAEAFGGLLMLLRDLRDAKGRGYEVQYKVLDTKHFGVPQSRPRLWIILVRSDVLARGLSWPCPSERPCRDIDLILGQRPPRSSLTRKYPSSTNAQANLLNQMRALKDKGEHPFDDTFILDIDHSQSRAGSSSKGFSPCLTRARARQGHWISTHGRRLNTGEMAQLQSMLPGRLRLPPGVSHAALNAMIGNSMSVNIIQCIVAMLSRSVPSLFHEPIADPWAG